MTKISFRSPRVRFASLLVMALGAAACEDSEDLLAGTAGAAGSAGKGQAGTGGSAGAAGSSAGSGGVAGKGGSSGSSGQGGAGAAGKGGAGAGGTAGASGQGGASGAGAGGAGAGGAGAGGAGAGGAGAAGESGASGQAGGAGSAGVGGSGGGGGLDLENPPPAKQIGELTGAEEFTDLWPASDRTFAFGLRSSSASIVDFADPTKPAEIAALPLGGRPLAVDYEESSRWAYVLDDSGTLSIWRLLDAENPVQIASVALPADEAAVGVTRLGNTVFVLTATSVRPVRVVKPGDGTATLEQGTPFSVGVDARAIAASGAFVRVALADGTLASWDVSGDTPQLAGSASLGGDFVGLLARGKWALTVLKGKGLRVLDLTDPSVPVTTFEDSALTDPRGVRLFGRLLVVTLERGYVSSIDLSSFAKPRVVTTNKDLLPAWVLAVNGNLIHGTGKDVRVLGVPPFVSARIPAPLRTAFPLTGRLPLTLSKPIDPATGGALTVSCGGATVEGSVTVGIDQRSLIFRPTAPLPASATCTVSLAGVADPSGTPLSAGDEVTFTTEPTAPAPITNPKSAYPHTGDGAFTDWTGASGGQYEWFDVKAAKGMYSLFYADFDGERLWLLNDWVYNSESINPDCYNQFQVWTGGGADRWDIRSYGDKRIEVWKNNTKLDDASDEVRGGYTFGASPNSDELHTMYELGIKTTPGSWGVQLHDPGPVFVCNTLQGDPTSYNGSLSDGGGSTTDPTGAVALPSAAGPGYPPNGATDVALTATLQWSAEGWPQSPQAWRVELSRGADFSDPFYAEDTYRPELPLRPGLLAPGTTYSCRVTSYNAAGQVDSGIVSFTTAIDNGAGGAGGAGGAAGSGGSGGAGAGGSASGQLCESVNDGNAYQDGTTMGDKLLAFKYVPTADKLVSGIEFFTSPGNGENKVAIYSHNDAKNEPLDIIGGEGTFTPTEKLTWQGASLPQPVQLTAGQTYWVGWHSQNNGIASLQPDGVQVTYRGFDTGGDKTWNGPFQGAWKFRLNCDDGGAGGAGGGGAGGDGGAGGGGGAGNGGASGGGGISGGGGSGGSSGVFPSAWSSAADSFDIYYDRVCAVAKDGTMWCWGGGVGSPTQVGTAQDWKSVAVGATHQCAIKQDGSLWCWGANDRAQLGNSSNLPSDLPTLVDPDPWLSVSAGDQSSCGVKQGGTLMCWGKKLADNPTPWPDNTTEDKFLPYPIDAGTDWLKTEIGRNNGCAITTSQVVKCFGNTIFGQMGNQSAPITMTPFLVAPTIMSQLSKGYGHACAIANGPVLCWGQGAQGSNDEPTLTSFGDGWQHVAAGHSNSCAVKADGTLWCWGSKSKGLLGDGVDGGFNGNTATPTQVGASTQWKRALTGQSFGCGLQGDDSLWCWGSNASGGVGLGATSATIELPTKVGTSDLNTGERDVSGRARSRCCRSAFQWKFRTGTGPSRPG